MRLQKEAKKELRHRHRRRAARAAGLTPTLLPKLLPSGRRRHDREGGGGGKGAIETNILQKKIGFGGGKGIGLGKLSSSLKLLRFPAGGIRVSVRQFMYSLRGTRVQAESGLID